MNTTYKETFNNFFSTQLNSDQQHVVSQKSGVLLVRAGAGSGKTRVITARMINLILNNECDPSALVAVTFTNKAAREMKERIESFLPAYYEIPFVGTFHSYCLRLLKNNSHLVSLSPFSIIDQEDQEKLMKSILVRQGIHKKITPKTVLYAISQVKNDSVTGTIIPHFSDPLLQQIFYLYEKEKSNSHCYDFDDLLVETVKLFKNNSDFKKKFQESIHHILIDEYQDTNRVQHALLKEIAYTPEKEFSLESLCVVGDEDQSIYSWRGATVSNIVDFKRDFPQTISITIAQNYRSVQPILDAANAIIKHNTQRVSKKLWSERVAHDRVRILSCASGYQEGEAIALFAKVLASKKISLQTMAVLYRSHYQSRALEEALIRHSIPYKIVGGIQFYERQEIKDLLAYMRLVANPYDRVSFMRIYTIPSRGLGEKFEELFFALWDTEPFLSFQGVIHRLIEQNKITGIKQQALEKLASVFRQLAATDKASNVLATFMQRIEYLTYLKEVHDPDDATNKIENVKELCNALQAMEERTPSLTLQNFLEEVALLQEQSAAHDADQDYIRLMTKHSAKGLEFDTVIITGLEEGILPSNHSLASPDSIEEERRLLYVGITRARERLLITHARYRYTYGTMTDQRSSRFLKELSEISLESQDASQWPSSQFSFYFNEWMLPYTRAVKLDSKKVNNAEYDTASLYNKVSDSRDKVSLWCQYQTVNHELFGVGIIQKIEKKLDVTFLTIRFSDSTKKLDSRFIKHVS